MRFISVCLVYLLLFLGVNLTVAFAHSPTQFPDFSEGQINEALQKTVPIRFLSSHPTYFLISTKEVIVRFFKPSSVKKAQFDLVLSGKRLKESYILLEKNDVLESGDTLERYSAVLNRMIWQLEKARSQNQEAVELVNEIADTLTYHEVLFWAIEKSWQGKEDSYSFDEKLTRAVSGFETTIMAVDKIKPGIKHRFKSLKETEYETLPESLPSPTPFEATPSVKPRRIIY